MSDPESHRSRPAWSVLSGQLSDALGEDHYVIAEPCVRRHDFDVIVASPEGLFVLQAKDWEGEVIPSRKGNWRERRKDGHESIHPNPAIEAKHAERALRAFLADAFPDLKPMIRHFVVFTDPYTLLSGDSTNPPVVAMDDIAETLMTLRAPPGADLHDAEDRRALAHALSAGRLGITERANQPFAFRSGGLLGTARKVWTIRDAVRHMDRHPQDGITHLRNYTLARWLDEQGAPDIADLAREAVHEHPSDVRAALECFLIGTGVVRRPSLVVRPRCVDFGYVLAGQVGWAPLTIRKGRGRGYLYGTVEAREHWLRVEPSAIQRGVLEATVSADTETLLIDPKALRTSLVVECNASEEPVHVPARLRIMPLPSRWDRVLVRPLFGALLAGLIGAAIGWFAGHAGLAVPTFSLLEGFGEASRWFWAVVVGIPWLALGALRGVFQTPAWPLSYATVRWLVRTLFWMAVLCALAIVVIWSGEGLGIETGVHLSETTRLAVLMLAAASSVLPATAGEIGSARAASEGEVHGLVRMAHRPALIGLVGVLLFVLAVSGVRAFDSVRRMYEGSSFVEQAQAWLTEHWAAWEAEARDFLDTLYVRYYDR